ncbi:transcription factor WRKY19-like [Phragmites australis]|uniref:transcription factor WRKY19-like n=1 Tax=Phragmites australis TaxID=29695 RepID=UPI002D79D69B|nr:transcription factor WRKY19-like [Phragmites australis]
MEGLSEERCALVAELVQVLEMARQLEAHMAGQQGGVAVAGGERCRALASTMRAAIDRCLHIARSCCAEGRLPAGQPESPPSGGDGSPRSAGSDQAGDSRGHCNAAGQCKKSERRKTLPKWATQVRVSAVHVAPLDDGFSWRKYGQKDILGAKYPRAYFRCTHRHTQGCHASKQVQRTDGDPLLFDVVYHGSHTCGQAQAAAHPNNPMPRLAASTDHSHSQAQRQPGQEQASASAGLEGGPMLPFSLPSTKPAGANTTDGETSSGFPVGCVTASTFMPPAPTKPEYQLVSSSSSSSYAVDGGGGMVGVGNVPGIELTSTTTSLMGDMDFMFPLDAADFLENPGYF